MADIETTFRIAGEGHRCLADYLLYRRHLFAYLTACRQIFAGAVVADIGCGYGYALEMLLEKASKVFAVDAADAALNSLPDLPDVEKIKSFAESLPLPDGSLDYIVAFQLLEHLPPDTVGNTLREFERVLRPGGRLFATTPNAKWRLFPSQKPWNPYHEREYRAVDLSAVCRESLSCKWQLKSVLGRNGAQEIELARVAPNPVTVYGAGIRGYATKIWQRYGPRRVSAWKKRGGAAILPQHRDQDWFVLSGDADAGLDLWLEIEK